MTKLYAYCLIALLAIPSALWAQGNEMYLLNSGMGAGEADNPLEPNSKLTLSALQGALLSPILDLRHAPLDPNANKTLNPATADYQLETFSNATFNTDGSSHTLRGAWAHATADQSTSFGARGNLQLLNLSISVFDHYDSATATNMVPQHFCRWFL